MTKLVASIYGSSLAELGSKVTSASGLQADLLELRVDRCNCQPDELAALLHTHPNKLWILTCRSESEGGRDSGTPRQRLDKLLALAKGVDVTLDFELDGWLALGDGCTTLDEIEKVLPNRAAGLSPRDPKNSSNHPACKPDSTTVDDTRSPRLILSVHDFDGAPEDLEQIVRKVFETQPSAIAKIAFRAQTITESFRALDLMKAHGARVVAIAMGEEGLWTRVLARKLGAFGTYCSHRDEEATAPGQLSIDTMSDRYRWAALGQNTRVFGVLGEPVQHSMSPALFNHWFERDSLDAVYLPLRVAASGGELARFLDACVARPWLDIGGFSVTVPHKCAALNWVGDTADRLSKTIGAVNTLVFQHGAASGFNTDSYAAIDSMSEALGCDKSELRGLPVDILGSGGAARAVLAALRDGGCRAVVYGRSAEKTKSVAGSFEATPAAWEDRSKRTGEVLINASSVGMWPNVADSPMPAHSLKGCRLVFDLIYNPLRTKLLQDTESTGAATLNGLDMFVRQAAAQYELWTGLQPSLADARDLITRRLAEDQGAQQ